MDGLELSIIDLGKGGWHGIGKRFGERASGADSGVGRGALGKGEIVGGKFNSFYDVFSSGFWGVHSVAPIAFRSAADVPTGDAMG